MMRVVARAIQSMSDEDFTKYANMDENHERQKAMVEIARGECERIVNDWNAVFGHDSKTTWQQVAYEISEQK